jgi:hypothetical protein
MRGSSGPSALLAQLQRLRQTAAACSGGSSTAGSQAAGVASSGWADAITTTSTFARPYASFLLRRAREGADRSLPAGSAPAAAAAAAAAATAGPPAPDQRRLYAKKAKSGGGGGGKSGGGGGGAAVSASPDDPDAAPPQPRVRPPFVAAARRRRLALAARPVPKAAREALAALAKLAPSSSAAAAAADDANDASATKTNGRRRRPHLLRDVAWPLDPQDALVLMHDATLGDVTGPGHALVVPHVTRDVLQSAQSCALFVRECIQDGVDFGRVEQFFVQTLAAQGQEQREEDARRAAEAAARATRRAAEAASAAVSAGGEEDGSSASPSTLNNNSTSSKTGITDLPDKPFRPPRLLIKGMRVQIKGRLRGKGGEAEKRTWSWGATSAATFDDAVDFAQAQAETRAGAVGVKVWLVFREDAFDRERYALLRRRARDAETGRAVWRGPGWAADAVEELALAARSGASRATGLVGSAVRRPATAWWSSSSSRLAAFASGGAAEDKDRV